MTTVASHFGINMGSAEREVKFAAQFILNAFFRVYNLQGVAFYDVTGKWVKVLDSDNHPADITYFIFHSVVATADVDSCTPVTKLSLEFSLCLPQSLSNSSSPSNPVITTDVDQPLNKTSSKPVADIWFALGTFLIVFTLIGRRIRCEPYLLMLVILYR